MIYRVVLSIGYRELNFDFTDGSDAIAFVQTAINNSVGSNCKYDESLTVSIKVMKKESEEN